MGKSGLLFSVWRGVPVGSTKRKERHASSGLAHRALATFLSGLLLFQPALLQAQQVTPDASAPAANRPDIGAVPNGIPLIDIVTPNSAGLSHNKYGDFNVGTPGLILNNYNAEIGNSKLGGVTPGNPNLRNSGPASVILNEVTSGNRSALEGPVEVFGGRADVVIANPNGITCSGCGFINTPHATLTTGKPDIDVSGKLSGFTVQGGDVTFGAKGGNFAGGDSAVDLFDVVSRKVSVDGPVAGKAMRFTVGRDRFDYATGEATALDGAADAGEFAIDGSALGAMQADSIKIVVTDKGAGVRMRADMAANAGDLTLSADGKISLGNASGRDGVKIRSNRQVEAKKLTSKKSVVVDAAAGMTLETVAADEDVALANGTGLLTIDSEVAALGNLTLNSSGAIAAGNISAGKDADIKAGQGIAADQIIADGAVQLTSTSGDIAISGLGKAGGGDLTVNAASGAISAGSLISFNNTMLSAVADIAITGDLLSGGKLTARARALALGKVVSGVDFEASSAAAGGPLVMKGGVGSAKLEATGGSVSADQIVSDGDLTVHAQKNISYDSLQSFAKAELGADQGAISLDHKTVAKGDITLSLQSLDLSGNRGKIATSGTLIVNADSANLSSSTLTFGGVALNLSGSANMAGTTLRALSSDGGTGNIAIKAQTVSTTASTSLLAANDMTLTLASLANAGQMAAGRDLTLTTNGNFSNTATGLVYAGQDGRFYVPGDLVNDQGAIVVGRDLTIAADAAGGRNHSITNISGLIQAGNDVSLVTDNLTNKRLNLPGLKSVRIDSDTLAAFRLNQAVAGQPFMQLYQGSNDDDPSDYLFPDLPRQQWEAYQDKLWSVASLADGTSFRAWTWITEVGPSSSDSIRDWIQTRVPRDANGNITLDPNNPSKYFIVSKQGKPRDTSTIYTWVDSARIGQSVYEDVFDGALSSEALIRSGRNLLIDSTVLNNASSSIEAQGNAVLRGGTLNNQGVMGTRKTLVECYAQGACEAYDASGNRNPSKDMAAGTSVLTKTEAVGLASANIKAAGALDVSFGTLNNSVGSGTIAGHTGLAAGSNAANPTAALNGLTAGGALFAPNAALGASASRPNSGGFGGTIPGQVFLYETRADFLDVGKFYGSGYFIDRIGYAPDREVPFLGDAYFENQLVDQQLRQLVGEGLGKGSFVPGSDAIEQMKSLLDNGLGFAKAHNLAIGEEISPELAANLTETMVWYEKKTVQGVEVLVPTVYVANTDKAKLTVAGALISGSSVSINAGTVANSGALVAKNDLGVNATDISANGGSFKAGNDLSLKASQNLTLTAQTVTVGGHNVVNPNAMVETGGDAKLAAGEALKLQGAGIETGGKAELSGRDVTLEAQKVDNSGSQNATGTRINADGDISITAQNDVNVIGSSAKAGGALGVTAEKGSVNIVTTDVTRQTDDGYTKTRSTTQQESQLVAGGNAAIKADKDILVSGSSIKTDGNTAIEAGRDINIAAAQDTTSFAYGKNSGELTTHLGSQITSKGNVSVSAGTNGEGNLAIIGSGIEADKSVDLKAADNVTIAEARDSQSYDFHNKSGGNATTDATLDRELAAGSSISGKTGISISSGKDTVISASELQAGDDDHKADLNIHSGGNLIVSSGKDVVDETINSKGKGFLSSRSWSYDAYDEATVASQLGASGNVTLDAGKNVVIAGSNVTADDSIAIAGDSVSIIGAQEAHELQTSQKISGLGAGSGGGFLSIWGSEQKSVKQSSTFNIGSQLSAGTDVTLTARDTDLNIIGSSVSADRDINLSATRDVNITPGAESFARSEEEKKSGFGISFSGGNGGFSVGIGAQKSTDKTEQGSNTNATSVLTAGHDLNISAGNNVNLQAVQASAERDVNLFAGKDINLLSAQDQTNYQEMHEKTFAGVTLSVSSQLGSAAQSIMNSAERLSDSGGVNALTNTAIAGLGFYQAYTDLKGVYKGLTSKDPKIGTGLSFEIGINAGISHQESTSSSSSSTPVVTGIRAGSSISMEAEKGSITSDGAQIAAGYDKYGLPTLSGDPLAGDIFLSAKNGDINLNSAIGTSGSTDSNSSWNAGIGVKFGCTTKNGCGDASFGVSGSYGKGGSETTAVTHTNTHLNGTGDVNIVTNDLALKGATIAGNSVTVDARSLTIESQVDTAKANADQLNLSGQIGFGASGLSGVTQKASGNAAVVSEQSGIHAGTGGLDIDVSGQTSLVGGLITSEANPDRNSLSSGTLTVTDIDTHSKWKAETYGGSIGASGLSIAPPIKAGESETGKAYSAIGGNVGITITDPAHQSQDIGTIRRDTDNTNNSLPGLPDLQNILRDQYKTQADLQEAQKTMAGLVGDIADGLRDYATTQAERDFWSEGGQGRALLHAIGGGILGGVNGWEGALKGALGGATTTLLAPAIAELVKGMLKDSTLSSDNKRTLAALVGASLSSIVGGVIGGGEGAAYGAANYQHNYLTHAQREEEIAKLKSCNGNQECIEKIVFEYLDLNVTQENQLIACKTTTCVDAIVASLRDSHDTLGSDYQELLKYSRYAAELALVYQQIDLVGQSQLNADIAYAYATANYCERNPGDNCKLNGGLAYFGSQLALEAAYGALGLGKGVTNAGQNGTGGVPSTKTGGFRPFKSTETSYDVRTKTYEGWDGVELEITGNPMPYRRAEVQASYLNGDLTINFYKTDVTGQRIGTELISNAIEAIGVSKVKTVSGQFGLENKSAYESLVSSGSSPTDAAWGTPLGRSMRLLGFTSVEVTPDYLPSFKFGFQ